MKDKTKAHINEVARLMWNEKYKEASFKISDDYDFSAGSPSGTDKEWWNMALIAYVEIKQRYDLLRFKI